MSKYICRKAVGNVKRWREQSSIGYFIRLRDGKRGAEQPCTPFIGVEVLVLPLFCRFTSVSGYICYLALHGIDVCFRPIPRSSRALPSRRGSGVERTSDQHLQAFATEMFPPAGNDPGV